MNALLFGCSPSGEEVKGIYYAEHGEGVEYIEMKGDHTFIQYFKNDSIEKKVNGRWKFEREGGQNKLILRDWTCFVDPFAFSDSTRKGSSSTASVYWDKNTITIYPDLPEYNYHKKK